MLSTAPVTPKVLCEHVVVRWELPMNRSQLDKSSFDDILEGIFDCGFRPQVTLFFGNGPQSSVVVAHRHGDIFKFFCWKTVEEFKVKANAAELYDKYNAELPEIEGSAVSCSAVLRVCCLTTCPWLQ